MSLLSGITKEEYVDLVLSIGTHKADRRLSPIAAARLISRASEHASLAEIAAQLQLASTDMLARLLRLLSLEPEIQNLVRWGNSSGFLSMEVARHISRLEDKRDRDNLAKAALEFGLSKTEVEAVVQRRLRSSVPIQQAIEEIAKLRPKVEKQHLFIGKLSSQTSSEDEIRRRMRTRLAERFGAKNVISVSYSEGRYAFLLHDGATSAADFAMLSPQSVDRFVAEIVSEH
jgi:hypothetical protein